MQEAWGAGETAFLSYARCCGHRLLALPQQSPPLSAGGARAGGVKGPLPEHHGLGLLGTHALELTEPPGRAAAEPNTGLG